MFHGSRDIGIHDLSEKPQFLLAPSVSQSSNSGLCGALPRHWPRADAGFSRVNFPNQFFTSSAFM
jgi:hypothetical protein